MTNSAYRSFKGVVEGSPSPSSRALLRDMRPRPVLDWSLDRIDPKDPVYGPGKCRWADKKTQTIIRTNTRTGPLLGTLQAFADQIGASYDRVWDAVERRETSEEIIAMSVRLIGVAAPPPSALP